MVVLLKKYWSHLFLVIAIMFILLQKTQVLSTKKEDEQRYIINQLGLDINTLSLQLDSIRSLKVQKIYVKSNQKNYEKNANIFNSSTIDNKIKLWTEDIQQ